RNVVSHRGGAPPGGETERCKQRVQAIRGWPARATRAVCEIGREEGFRRAVRDRRGIATRHVDPLHHVVEWHVAAPRPVSGAEPVEVEGRTVAETKPLEHLFGRRRRKHTRRIARRGDRSDGGAQRARRSPERQASRVSRRAAKATKANGK